MNTDNNTPADTKELEKTKGPIRFEAIVPIAIVCAATYFYFALLFDLHLRKGIEWTASYVHGAEVNVAKLHTSFLRGTFRMTGLQVTDKEEPTRNLIVIGDIRFGFLWDALLRAKFVVEDAGIDQIQIYAPRRRAGWVRPPAPPSAKPSAMAQLEQNVLEQTKQDHETNVIGDLAKLLEGTDEKEILNQIQQSLKAEETIKNLSSELKNKEAAWKERIDNLPNKNEFDAILKQAKALKFNSKNPKQFAADAKEAQKLAKLAEAKMNEIKKTSGDLKGDLNKYTAELKQIDDLVKKDIADIEKRLNLPDLDVVDFSKNIFSKSFAKHLGTVEKYMTLGREYMPPPKDPSAQPKKLVPRPRGQGENINFPITTSYPLFWLKKATISSEPTPDGFSGKIAGQLTDVTTSPAAINKPAVLDVKGDFPKSNIFGTQLLVNIDHRKTPVETLKLNVASYPLSGLSLVKSTDVQLALQKATGGSRLEAKLENQTLDVQLNNEFTELSFDMSAKNKTVNEALTSIISGIPVITVNARAKGTWKNIDMSINSNLGRELEAGFKKFIKEKVDAIRTKVRAAIDERIKAERAKLDAEYKKVKDQVDNTLKSKTAELDKARAEIKKATSVKPGAAQKEQLKQSLKDKLKGLKGK